MYWLSFSVSFLFWGLLLFLPLYLWHEPVDLENNLYGGHWEGIKGIREIVRQICFLHCLFETIPPLYLECVICSWLDITSPCEVLLGLISINSHFVCQLLLGGVNIKKHPPDTESFMWSGNWYIHFYRCHYWGCWSGVSILTLLVNFLLQSVGVKSKERKIYGGSSHPIVEILGCFLFL